MLLHVQKLHANDFVEEHRDWVHGEGVGQTQVRAVGWHAGEIIKGIGIESGIEKTWTQKSQVDGDVFQWNWQMHLGLAWETYMVKRLPAIWQPGEVGIKTGLTGKTLNGWSKGRVYMNPDGWSPEVEWWDGRKQKVGVLEEFKLTAKSAGREPETFWSWLMQTKLYLKAYQKEGVFGCREGESRFARIWVCFKVGDYRGGDEMVTSYCWWLEYEQQEIEAAWEVMKAWLKDRK